MYFKSTDNHTIQCLNMSLLHI